MALRRPPLGLATVVVMALACAQGSSAKTQRAWRSSGKVETLPDGTRVICTMERPTGSHIPEPVCRSVEEIERTREKTQAGLSATPSVQTRRGN